MKRNKGLVIVICISVTLIVIINAICVLVACCPELISALFDVEINTHMKGPDRVESSIISTGVSILGIAVAVWTGLSIANTIDKKRIDEIDEGFKEKQKGLEESIDEIGKRINDEKNGLERLYNQANKNQEIANSINKDRFLQELCSTGPDPTSIKLFEFFRDNIIESNVSFIELLEIEQRFSLVYTLHNSAFKHDEKLIKAANEGIIRAEQMRKTTSHSTVELYLKYRIADFNFYMGYCHVGEERLRQFTEAIKTYTEVANDFSAYIPPFENDEIYPNIHYKPNEKNYALSAYFCNAIGEAYSKIEQNREELSRESHNDEELDLYGKKAIYYCAYANRWGDKSIYKRNLGCAIERFHGFKSNKSTLASIYDEALKLEPSNPNNYKVVLSLKDKCINDSLEIRSILPDEKRQPKLSSKEFAEKWNGLSSNSKKVVTDDLSQLNTLSNQAKTIHPTKSVGYQYACIYFRDMCAIYGNHMLQTDSAIIGQMKQEAKQHFDQAEENWALLNIIVPYDSNRPRENPMTQILRNDLDDLRSLL